MCCCRDPYCPDWWAEEDWEARRLAMRTLGSNLRAAGALAAAYRRGFEDAENRCLFRARLICHHPMYQATATISPKEEA